ncbi:MAG: hypothetical protein ACOYKA_02275 [Legionellaceae bacterium]
MSGLIVFIAHHTPMQLRVQTRKLPEHVAHVAIYLKDEVFMKFSQSPSVTLASTQWESIDSLIEALEQLKTMQGFTHLILCADANLSQVGGDKTSELLKLILHNFCSISRAILHTQEALCYDDALQYMEAYQQARPSLDYIICMHQDLLPALANPETTAPVITREIIPPRIEQTLLNSPESVASTQLEAIYLPTQDPFNIAPSTAHRKRKKPTLFSLCSFVKRTAPVNPEPSYSP